jgi:CspA family cold shock protein
VHKNSLIDEINEGDKVSYDVEETPKGMNAINVKVV